MRADHDRLADVLEAISRIERHTAAGRAAFDADELVQVWVVRHLQIIGEAVAHLSDERPGGHGPGLWWGAGEEWSLWTTSASA
ncbi:MAG: DUF86 domain-containing protein, partial [Acidobacteria bacterium]|nr:DUF86 domain-containing protein [Acidobacteriota bacterium]